MGKNLVIVESPAKAKTINKILGKDFVVKSSMGHVRDLPVRTLGVDIKNDFTPKYVVVKGRQKVVAELEKAAKSAEAVYLAPDPDREGEAIAWHLRELLEPVVHERPFYRVQYNEITPGAVRSAFEHPSEIDLKRVDAQQARRVLDRIVGYMVSPMLWRQIARGLSAGRVQSVALRVVCEREEEIRNFVPEEYWLIGAVVHKLVAPVDPFRVRLARIAGKKAEVKSSEQAESIRRDLEGRTLRVADVARRDVRKRPYPPFITSTLQQAASTVCGFSPSRTMSLAQKLYEGVNLGEGPVGLITYMRTDSVNVSRDALGMVRAYINQTFGEPYCPEKPNIYRSRNSAQEAHEAIRPTDVTRTPDAMARVLDPQELKVYRLIWERFVASQMTPAVIEQRTAEIEAVPEPERPTVYTFRASASEVKFPGYMKVTGADAGEKDDEGDAIDALPALEPGESLALDEWQEERKETKPPSRYSEASLIRVLESNGVGRPSTYAQIIGTLHQRKYVTRVKRTVGPTPLGESVNALLVAKLGELFNVDFTASMEELLDEIERGSVEWTKMLGDFFAKFEKWMEATRAPTAKVEDVLATLELLSNVSEWNPEVQRGKRKYSDAKFVESVRTQLDKGEKAVSERQLDALLKIGVRYREQVPAIVELLARLGRSDLLDSPDVKPPLESTTRKLELLAAIELDEKARDFIESLSAQAQRGRRLSDAQRRALDSILTARSDAIEGFDEIKHELNIQLDEADEDRESGPLLDAMAHVVTWNEPVTRGKRVFDDKAFYESLDGQYKRRGSLTPRQRAALKRLCGRYAAQIPGYKELAGQFGLRDGKAKKTADAAAE